VLLSRRSKVDTLPSTAPQPVVVGERR
jgi:hypothetical protein